MLNKPTRSDSRFAHRSILPAGIGLLLAAPAAFAFAALAMMAVAGGSALALLFPLFLPSRRLGAKRDDDCIVLERDQYWRVDEPESHRP